MVFLRDRDCYNIFHHFLYFVFIIFTFFLEFIPLYVCMLCASYLCIWCIWTHFKMWKVKLFYQRLIMFDPHVRFIWNVGSWTHINTFLRDYCSAIWSMSNKFILHSSGEGALLFPGLTSIYCNIVFAEQDSPNDLVLRSKMNFLLETLLICTTNWRQTFK